MRNFLRFILIFGVVLFAFSFCSSLSFAASDIPVVSFTGKIDSGSSLYLNRILSAVKRDKPAFLIIEIDSEGGELSACEKIKSAITNDTDVTVIAFITGRALNEASLIPFSCSKIYMTELATIGNASSDKALVSSLTSLVSSRHPNARGAESQVFTASQAEQMLFISGIASSPDDFIKSYSGEAIKYADKKPTWMEHFAGVATNPVFAVVILILGVAGAIKEMLAPGHGVGGTLAAVFLGIFFAGKFIAGSSMLLAVILMVAGLVFLFIEIFFTPGVGFPAVAGLACIIISIVLSFDDLTTGVTVASFVIIGTILLLLILFNYIIKNKSIFERFAPKPLDDGTSDVVHSVVDFDSFYHKSGVAITDLKPTGKARFGEDVIDVITKGSFLMKDTEIFVEAVEGNKVIVIKL